MVRYPLRILFALTLVCAAFFAGWRLLGPGEELLYPGEEWRLFFFAGTCLVAVAMVLIHGSWRIVPWFLAGFAFSALSILLTVGWDDDAAGNYLLAAICCGLAALVGSIVLIGWGSTTNGESIPQSLVALKRWVPWLCLVPAIALTGLFLQYMFHFVVEIGIDAEPFKHIHRHLVPMTFFALLAIVLIHGSWRVVPWCLLGFFGSGLAIFAIFRGESVPLDLSDWIMMSCFPAMLLGGYKLIRPTRAALTDVEPTPTCDTK